MKEHPILFSGPMVRAILEGRKTMTRRVVKPQLVEHVHIDTFRREVKMWSLPKPKSLGGGVIAGQLPALAELCPYGQVMDRLWVRETWAHSTNVNDEKAWPDRPHKEVERLENGNVWSAVIYRADGETQWLDDDGWNTEKSYWKPSIHMPRWASRITLEIVSVRVERVCEADDTSIMREGIQKCTKDGELFKYGLDEWPWSEWCMSPLEAWRKLWVQINGKESWDANPWVWVVEFRRVV